MYKAVGKLFYSFERLKYKCISAYQKSMFQSVGKDVYVGRGCIFTPESIRVGNHVYFGAGCVIQSAHGKITIGNHVMFGPGVHIHGGNHKMNEIGLYMDQVKKEPGSDGELVIEDDIWIGANAIILEKVHIGKGAVVAAGSVVNKPIPAYEVWGGVPARKLKDRFTPDEIEIHERKLSTQ